MATFKINAIIFLAVSAFVSCAFLTCFAEEAPDASKVIIKVDSDGLRAEIIVTGRAVLPEGLGVDSPETRPFTKKAAVALAYDNLVKIAEAIAPDYFPKERYFSEDGSLKGARLAEVRYFGDGSAEADLELDIALNGPLTNKFEKAMQLAGYRVCEYDRPNIEITNETMLK
ncbi:MAG: hypothetical protein V1883_01205 [Candidatus Omnitrophota bacterium]